MVQTMIFVARKLDARVLAVCVSGLAMALSVGSGCASGWGGEAVSLPSVSALVEPGDVPRGTVGWVVRVSENADYIVIKGQHLPSPGKRGKIYREELLVGMVQFDKRRETHFGIANIIDGVIQKGDRVVY